MWLVLFHAVIPRASSCMLRLMKKIQVSHVNKQSQNPKEVYNYLLSSLVVTQNCFSGLTLVIIWVIYFNIWK